jgi:hypothetical protein
MRQAPRMATRQADGDQDEAASGGRRRDERCVRHRWLSWPEASRLRDELAVEVAAVEEGLPHLRPPTVESPRLRPFRSHDGFVQVTAGGRRDAADGTALQVQSPQRPLDHHAHRRKHHEPVPIARPAIEEQHEREDERAHGTAISASHAAGASCRVALLAAFTASTAKTTSAIAACQSAAAA